MVWAMSPLLVSLPLTPLSGEKYQRLYQQSCEMHRHIMILHETIKPDKNKAPQGFLRPYEALWYYCLAEREGFEPPEVLPSTVFTTAAISRSAISPCHEIEKYAKKRTTVNDISCMPILPQQRHYGYSLKFRIKNSCWRRLLTKFNIFFLKRYILFSPTNCHKY